MSISREFPIHTFSWIIFPLIVLKADRLIVYKADNVWWCKRGNFVFPDKICYRGWSMFIVNPDLPWIYFIFNLRLIQRAFNKLYTKDSRYVLASIARKLKIFVIVNELLSRLKDDFHLKFWDFFQSRWKKITFQEMRFNPCEIRLTTGNSKCRNFKILYQILEFFGLIWPTSHWSEIIPSLIFVYYCRCNRIFQCLNI